MISEMVVQVIIILYSTYIHYARCEWVYICHDHGDASVALTFYSELAGGCRVH